MAFFRVWILGIKSLMLHPLRSLLAVLGIFFGVASVIWLLAIGDGISREAQKQIEGLGANNIIIRSVKPPAEATAGNRGPTPYGLRRSEYFKLMETVNTIESALQIREIRRQFRYGGRLVDGRLVGCEPEYANVTRLEIDRGRFISPADLRERHNHCVLAARVADRLFPFEDPIGRRLYLAEHKDFYYIVGVVKHRDPTAAIGGSLEAQDFSNDVYIPITTMQRRIGDTVITRGSGSFEGEIIELNQITLRIRGIDNVPKTAEVVKEMFGISDNKDALQHAMQDELMEIHRRMQDVAVIVPKELLDQARRMQVMFMFFMGLIAAISLLVGGIGIMNIMLATVTERTREIGIRRALGATQPDIVLQFLIETIVLTVVGGAIGIVAGYGCPVFADMARALIGYYSAEFLASLPDIVRNVQPQVVPISIPIAFSISVLIGVVFGLYPAIRASMLDPIEALRHE